MWSLTVASFFFPDAKKGADAEQILWAAAKDLSEQLDIPLAPQ